MLGVCLKRYRQTLRLRIQVLCHVCCRNLGKCCFKTPLSRLITMMAFSPVPTSSRHDAAVMAGVRLSERLHALQPPSTSHRPELPSPGACVEVADHRRIGTSSLGNNPTIDNACRRGSNDHIPAGTAIPCWHPCSLCPRQTTIIAVLWRRVSDGGRCSVAKVACGTPPFSGRRHS